MLSKRVLSFIFLCIVNISVLYAQQTFSITGTDIESNDCSFCYTIGSFSYENFSNSSLQISNGVQQPIEIQSSLKFEEAKNEIELYCKIFPNPTSDYVNLTIDNYVIEDVYYIFTNRAGQTKRSGKIIGNKTSFGVSNLADGLYLLKIWSINSKIKTYKVIKK